MVRGRRAPDVVRMGVRLINALLGAWLFLSAFMWSHLSAQRTNGWVVGLLTVAVALAGLSGTNGRIVNAALGGWLMISAILLPRLMPATFVNHVVAGAAIVFVALVARLPEVRSQRARVS